MSLFVVCKIVGELEDQGRRYIRIELCRTGIKITVTENVGFISVTCCRIVSAFEIDKNSDGLVAEAINNAINDCEAAVEKAVEESSS